MRKLLLIGAAVLLCSCAIEHQGPPGVTLTRPIRVRGADVLVFKTAADVKGHYSVVDSVWVRDDGDTPPRVLEHQLRELAGSRGANAIIMDTLNRQLNGTRLYFSPTLDDPFKYFSATAIWIGEGKRPEKYLGTIRSR